MQITVDGHRISYEDFGRGAPVVLMHAFPLDQSMFRDQGEALADIARVLTFDAPGVGESSPRETVSIDGLADMAAALLDALKIDRAVVGGVSMGGYAAFSFARRYPERLLGLVLANTRAVADSEEAKKARREMMTVARQQGPGEVAKKMLPKLLGETTQRERPAVVERVRAMAESVPGETVARLLAALAGRTDSTDLLAKIAVPTLVIAGEQDSIATPVEGREWAGRIPGARFVELKGAGHLPNLETPALFNGVVREFLSSIPQ